MYNCTRRKTNCLKGAHEEKKKIRTHTHTGTHALANNNNVARRSTGTWGDKHHSSMQTRRVRGCVMRCACLSVCEIKEEQLVARAGVKVEKSNAPSPHPRLSGQVNHCRAKGKPQSPPSTSKPHHGAMLWWHGERRRRRRRRFKEPLVPNSLG